MITLHCCCFFRRVRKLTMDTADQTMNKKSLLTTSVTDVCVP